MRKMQTAHEKAKRSGRTHSELLNLSVAEIADVSRSFSRWAAEGTDEEGERGAARCCSRTLLAHAPLVGARPPCTLAPTTSRTAAYESSSATRLSARCSTRDTTLTTSPS